MDTPTEVDPLDQTHFTRTTFGTLLAAVDRPFLVLDVAVRLPTAMLPLGILLYVADRSGSFATGGPAVAALSIGGGLGGSLVGISGPASPAAGALVVLGGLASSVAHHPALLAASCLLLGIALAPALISSYALAERAAPAGWATTMMTALGTANVVGVAAGAAVAGLLVDRVSPGAALLVDVVAGVLVLMAGMVALFATPTR